jgi:capsular polysaccharide biosynthesis protein
MKVSSPEILKRLVRRFGLLVLLTVLGGGAGAAYAALKTPTYTAQAYVVVTAEPGESVAALNYAQAYGRIATKGAVTDRAGATLGTAKADLKRVTASTSPDTPVIEITSTGTKAKQTADVANAVAKALVDYGTARKDQTRVGLAVLATASVPRAPSSPKPPLELAVGAAGGLLIGGLAVLAGVGRAAARKPREDEPARYDVDEYEDPATSRNRITSFRGSAAPTYTPKAITSYSAAAAPMYPEPAVYDAEPTAVIPLPRAEAEPMAQHPMPQQPMPQHPMVPWPIERPAQQWQAGTPVPQPRPVSVPPVSAPPVSAPPVSAPPAASAATQPVSPAAQPVEWQVEKPAVEETPVAKGRASVAAAPAEPAPEGGAPDGDRPAEERAEQAATERIVGRASVNREQS